MTSRKGPRWSSSWGFTGEGAADAPSLRPHQRLGQTRRLRSGPPLRNGGRRAPAMSCFLLAGCRTGHPEAGRAVRGQANQQLGAPAVDVRETRRFGIYRRPATRLEPPARSSATRDLALSWRHAWVDQHLDMSSARARLPVVDGRPKDSVLPTGARAIRTRCPSLKIVAGHEPKWVDEFHEFWNSNPDCRSRVASLCPPPEASLSSTSSLRSTSMGLVPTPCCWDAGVDLAGRTSGDRRSAGSV